MQVAVENYTPFRRAIIHVQVVPLADGVLRPADDENALTIHDSTSPGSTHWVQWWPLTTPREWIKGRRGDLYPSGYIKRLRVAFPVIIDAGVARASRGDSMGYDYFRRAVYTITKTNSTPVPFFPHPDVTTQLTSTVFELNDGQGRMVSQTLNPETDRLLFPNHHGTQNGYLREYESARRMSVVNPETESAIVQSVVYSLQSEFFGNSRCVEVMHTWTSSDPRRINQGFMHEGRITLRVGQRCDAFMPIDRWRNPEWVPSTFSSDGLTRLTVGSGTARIVSGSIPARDTRFALWDPDDRVGVRDITRDLRDGAFEGTSRKSPMVLTFPAGDTPLIAEEISTIAAWETVREDALIGGISPDWKDFPELWLDTGHLPGRDDRRAFASDTEAFEAAANQSVQELRYHRVQSLRAELQEWYCHDPAHRAHEGMRPDLSNSGDSPGFGFTAGFKHAVSGCGDLRHTWITVINNFAHQGFDWREVDGSRYDPENYWLLPGQAEDFGWAVCPAYNGYLGYAGLFSHREYVHPTTGKQFATYRWGVKGYVQNSTGTPRRLNGQFLKCYPIVMDSRGELSGRSWRLDETMDGGLERAHHNLMNQAFIAMVMGSAWMLDAFDCIQNVAVATWLTPHTADALEYYRKQIEDVRDGTLPEHSRNFLPHNRHLGRGLQGLALCHVVSGAPEVARTIRSLTKMAADFAVGSKRRTIFWDDPTRSYQHPLAGSARLVPRPHYRLGQNPHGYPLTREFNPLDVPQLWCWAFAGYDLADTSHVQFSTSGGLHISWLRNLQGNAARDFTVTGYRGSHPGPGGLNTDDFTSIMDIDVSYQTPLNIISDHSGFGPGFSQSESIDADGEFLFQWAMINTRSAGNRYVFGVPGGDTLRQNQSTASEGGIWMTIGGGALTKISSTLPHGPLVITVWRDASNVMHVEANGYDYSLGVTMAGTFDPQGFGGNDGSIWDDFLLEFLSCKGAVSAEHRRQLTEFLRFRWKIYERARTEPADYYTDHGLMWHVPTLFYWDWTGNSDIRYPSGSCFEMALCAAGFYSAWRVLADEAARSPSDPQWAEMRDFSVEWMENAARFFVSQSGSSNKIYSYEGVSGLRVPVYFSSHQRRFRTPEEMEWDGVTPAPDALGPEDPTAPGWYMFTTTGLHFFYCQYFAPIWFALKFASSDKALFFAAADILENEMRGMSSAYNPSREDSFNRWGWGQYDYEQRALEKWLSAYPFREIPDINTTLATINLRGSSALTATPGADRKGIAALKGGSKLSVIASLLPANRFIDMHASLSGKGGIGALATKETLVTAQLKGGSSLKSTPKRDCLATATLAGTSKLSAFPRLPASVYHDANAKLRGASALVATPLRDALCEVEIQGAGSLSATARRLRIVAASATLAGKSSLKAFPGVAPAVISDAKIALSGSSALQVDPDVILPTLVSVVLFGGSQIRVTPFIARLPAVSAGMRQMQFDALEIIEDCGIDATYYMGGDESMGRTIKAYVDFQGIQWDGNSRVEMAEVWVARTAELGVPRVQVRDLIDIPMQAGAATTRCVVNRIIDQAPNVWRLEVRN